MFHMEKGSLICPEKTSPERMKLSGAAWRNMTTAEKMPWFEMAKADKKRFDREYAVECA